MSDALGATLGLSADIIHSLTSSRSQAAIAPLPAQVRFNVNANVHLRQQRPP